MAIALFDFDGTLTTKDSMRLFFAWVDPRGVGWWRFLRAAPGVVLSHGFRREPLKTALVHAFLAGKTQEELAVLGRQFVQDVLPAHLNQTVLARMRRYRDEGARVAIVSASLDVWLRPFAKQEGVALLCTEAAYTHGLFMGEWQTPNCNGVEKRRRVELYFPDWTQQVITVYGNSAGDAAMLQMADEAWWVDGNGVCTRWGQDVNRQD
jgi:HAD superfamily hydrolase (TIGR01490 family)